MLKPGQKCDPLEYYAVLNDCSKFARCIHGQLQEVSCSPGLLWNDAEKLCDWPSQVSCKQLGKSSWENFIDFYYKPSIRLETKSCRIS